MYDQDVANLFVPELLDLNNDFMMPPAKPPVVEEAAAAIAVLDPEIATAAPDTVLATNQDLGRLSVEHRTNKLLSEGTPTLDSLNPLRASYAQPSPDDTIHGAIVAVAEDGEDIDDVSPQSLASERKDTISRLAGDRLDKYAATSTTPGAFALELADEVSQAFKPFSADKFRLGTILQQAFPDDADIQRDGHQNLSAAIRKAHALFLNNDMSVEVARAKMDQIEKGVIDASDNGYFSRAQAYDMLSSVLGPVAENDAEGFATDVETFASAAEVVGNVLGVGGLLGRGAKAAGRLASRASTPVPSVGLLKGTYAAAVAQTKAGYEGLVGAIRSRASGTPQSVVSNATRTEDIMDAIAVPKVDGVDVTKMPYIQSSLVDEATRDQLLKDPAYVFGAGSVKRINSAHTSAEVGDGGITMTASFGTKNGAGYKTEAAAKAANKREFGGLGKVQKDGNSYYVQVERSREFGLEDAAKAPDLTQPGTALGRSIVAQGGKMMYTTKFGAVSSATSTRQTEKVESALAEGAKPFFFLPAGSQRNVAKALDYADAEEQALDVTDLRGAFGLNDKEILGYYAIRKLADISLALDNARLHAKYTADGWKSLVVNGRNYGIKTMEADVAAADAGLPLSSVKAIDASTGLVVNIDKLPPNKVVAKMMTPGRNGERYMVIDRVDTKRITDLPRDVIPRKEGYLPRPYKYPAYVKRFKDGKVVETIRGARSQLEADELAEELKAATPGEDFRAVVAQEFRDVNNLDEMAALEDAGLLFSSVRGPSKLLDASGSTRMFTVEDRIRKMIGDGAMAAGLSRWGDAQRLAWNAKYGNIVNGKWSIGQPSGNLAFKGDAADAKMVQRAKHEAEFINNVMGVGTGAIARTARTIGSDLAGRFYNTATRLDKLANKVRGDKKGSSLANDLRDIGDNLSGASGRILANAKTVPYMLFLAGNPLRQLPLQMTLIPSYFGVTGAGKYALGGFQRDFSILTASGLADSGAKLAGKLGSDAELVDQFRRSGLMQSMEHHTMVSQVGSGGVTSRATRFGSAVEGTTKALTNVGIGAGIRVEKVSAWLIARNRWKTLNPGKKIDKAAEEEILSFAEELSLNPNRSDTLPINHGVLGLFTQFLSMQVKQIGRTFQALPGVSSGQLTKREAAQMAAINLSVYGITGYGAKELASSVLSDPVFDDVASDIRETVADGISNYVLDTVLEAWTNEKADTAFSESFSPNSQLGGSVRLVANLKDIVIHGDWSSLAESRWQAPALGLTKQVADTISFMAAVYGAPPLPTPESDAVKQAAVIKKAMSILPAFSNWQKMQAALNMGAKFNGRGDPTVEASYGEALAAVLGVKTKEEVQLWELNNLVTSQNLESSDFLPNVRDAAYETSRWLLPLLDEMVDGKITPQEALSYIDLNNAVQMTTLSKEHHAAYVDYLREAVDKRWTPRYDALLERILNQAGTDKLPVTEDAIQAIAIRIPDPVKREQAVSTLKSKLFGAE